MYPWHNSGIFFLYRRGKGRKISTSSVSSLPKKARISPEPENKVENLEVQANTSRRSTRTPKKVPKGKKCIF